MAEHHGVVVPMTVGDDGFEISKTFKHGVLDSQHTHSDPVNTETGCLLQGRSRPLADMSCLVLFLTLPLTSCFRRL